MLDLTTQAKDVLHDALSQRGLHDRDVAFRLRIMRDQHTGRKRFGLTYDRAQEGDQVVEHSGRKILVVDERISAILDGITLKAVDTPRGQRLRFQRLGSRRDSSPDPHRGI